MVVDHHRHAVGRQVHVELQEAQALLERRGEGGEGVFRKVARVAAVRDQMDQSIVVQAKFRAVASRPIIGARRLCASAGGPQGLRFSSNSTIG